MVLVLDMFIVGILELWPSFRTRAYSVLLAQGGQISSAAGVAAMLGDASIEKIKATTQKQHFMKYSNRYGQTL